MIELKKEAKSENEPIRRSLPKRSAAVIGELKRRYQSKELTVSELLSVSSENKGAACPNSLTLNLCLCMRRPIFAYVFTCFFPSCK